MRTLLCLNINSKGERVDIPMATVLQMRCIYVSFLHTVYIETGVSRLLSELTMEDNGMWSLDSANPLWQGCTPYMVTIHGQVKAYVNIMKASLTQNLALKRLHTAYGVELGVLTHISSRPRTAVSAPSLSFSHALPIELSLLDCVAGFFRRVQKRQGRPGEDSFRHKGCRHTRARRHECS